MSTLVEYALKPLTQHRVLAGIPMAEIAKRMKPYLASADKPKPETLACRFYSMNHLSSMIRQARLPYEPLGPGLTQTLETYYSQSTADAYRMFFYLLLICSRESRHVHGGYDWSKAAQKMGASSAQYAKTIGGESGVIDKLTNSPPPCTLGQWTEHLVNVFRYGHFNGGFGGPDTWGSVADCLHKFVIGQYSPEMMLDTSFTLAHNNGPIFNKNMLFSWSGTASAQELLKILDVQRAGQMIPFILNNGYAHADPGLPDLLKHGVAHGDFEVPAYVDWYVVEALGALGSYGAMKAQQVQKYGPSPHMNELEKMAAAKSAAEQAAAAAEAEEYAKHWMQITPNLKVKKIPRSA